MCPRNIGPSLDQVVRLASARRTHAPLRVPTRRTGPPSSVMTATLLTPLGPLPGLDPNAATQQTRDQARARILAALDEPDLSETDGVAALQGRRS